MGLNIKNERVHELAREAARLTGKSQTGAIEEALVLLLREYDADPVEARLARRLDVAREIAVAYASDPGQSDRTIRRIEDLYEESSGLPR